MGCGASTTEHGPKNKKSLEKAQRKARLRAYRNQVLSEQNHDVERDPKLDMALEVLALLPYPTLVWSEDGTIQHANAAALEMLRHDEDSLRIGNHLSKVLGFDHSRSSDFLENPSTATEIITSDGERIPANISVALISTSETKENADQPSEADLFLGTLEWWAPCPKTPSVPSVECNADKVPIVQLPEQITITTPVMPMEDFSDNSDSRSPGPNECYPRVRSNEGSPRARSNDGNMSPRMRSVHFSHSQLADDAVVLLDSLQHAAMILTATGQIVHWNTGCERLFGPTSNQIIGHQFDVLIPAPYHFNHQSYLKENLASENAIKEKEGVQLDPKKPKIRTKMMQSRHTSMPRKKVLARFHDVVGRRIDCSKLPKDEPQDLPTPPPGATTPMQDMTVQSFSDGLGRQDTWEQESPEKSPEKEEGGTLPEKKPATKKKNRFAELTSHLSGKYFGLRIMLAECQFNHLKDPYWMVICTQVETLTPRQETLLSGIAETKTHPATLPAVRPSLNIAQSRSILSGSKSWFGGGSKLIKSPGLKSPGSPWFGGSRNNLLGLKSPTWFGQKSESTLSFSRPSAEVHNA
eukprot:Hpha_TRINITY_DN1302_c0_g1::TRINITY_DN1302_c0_g1_i1::g.93468::m.93468